MKTFTTNTTTFTTNENETYFYAIWTENGKQMKKRIKKAEFEQAEREALIEEAQESADTEAAKEYDQWAADADAEYQARKDLQEAKDRETEANYEAATRKPKGTDLKVPAVLNQYGCVDCSKCNVQNCVHRDCMRRNPTSEGGLAECPRLKVKAEESKKTRKPRRSKDIAYEGHGVTLTAKQVDFLRHLPDTCFWEHGLDSGVWTDVLADEIGGQFKDKPMTTGAMLSTICEKGLGERVKDRINNRKATAFYLTELGKIVAAELGVH